MSVVIRGMEMPKDGGLLCVNIYPDGKVCINLDLECKRIATAVPIPKHGRLIDADAIRADIDEKRPGRSYEDAWTLTVIDAAPTIIPAEDSKLSATIKCGGAVTCAVAYSEEVYNKYVDTAGNLRWTGTHSGEHIIPASEGGE